MDDKSHNNHSHPTRYPHEAESDPPLSGHRSSEAIPGHNTSHDSRSRLIADDHSGTPLPSTTAKRPHQAFTPDMYYRGPSLDQPASNTSARTPARGLDQDNTLLAQSATKETEQIHPAQSNDTTGDVSGFAAAMTADDVRSAKVQASDDDDMSFAEREAAMWEVYMAENKRFQEDFDFAISERRRERGLPPEEDA